MFIVRSTDLIHAIGIAKAFAAKPSERLPESLGGIRFRISASALLLEASNSYRAVQVRLSVEGEVEEADSGMISAKQAAEIAKTLPKTDEAVEVELGGHDVRIGATVGDRVSGELPAIERLFPHVTAEAASFSMSQEHFKALAAMSKKKDRSDTTFVRLYPTGRKAILATKGPDIRAIFTNIHQPEAEYVW